MTGDGAPEWISSLQGALRYIMLLSAISAITGILALVSK